MPSAAGCVSEARLIEAAASDDDDLDSAVGSATLLHQPSSARAVTVAINSARPSGSAHSSAGVGVSIDDIKGSPPGSTAAVARTRQESSSKLLFHASSEPQDRDGEHHHDDNEAVRLPSEWQEEGGSDKLLREVVFHQEHSRLPLSMRIPRSAMTNWIYLFVNALALIARVSDLVLLEWVFDCNCIGSPCDLSPRHPICATWYSSTRSFRYTIGQISLFGYFLATCWRLGRPSSKDASAVDHWVPAASSEYFEETSQALLRIQARLFRSMVAVSSVLVLASLWRSGHEALTVCRAPGEDLPASETDPQAQPIKEWCAKLDSICGSSGLTLCHAAYHFKNPFLACALAGTVVMIGTVYATPSSMWRPVVRKAIEESGQERLRKLIMLPNRTIPFVAANVFGSWYIKMRMDDLPPGVTKLEVICASGIALFFGISTMAVAMQGGSSVQPRLPPCISRLLRAHLRLSNRVAGLADGQPAESQQTSLQPQRSPDEGNAEDDDVSRSALSRFCRYIAKASVFYARDSSLRQVRMVMILTSGMLCVTMPQGKTLPVYLTMWAIILASVVAVFRVRDMPMDFELLAQSPGPGMGLVVYRQDMCRIIRALVAGEDLTSTDDIPRFKASAFRMQDTLAVSYRWQAERRAIGKTTFINMSDFQMRALLKVMSKVSHMYVWIDVLAVYQQPGELQRTLLTRMMAVYCGAHLTVGIRTPEEPKSRYHQRAWTLQEYCIANNLVIVDETPPVPGIRAISSSSQMEVATVAEIEFFRRLRAEVQRDVQDCRPFWLYGGFTSATPLQSIRKLSKRYHQLCGIVNCLNEEDKLRALVPILASVPVATQAELVQLLEQAAEHLGVVAFDEKREPLLHAAANAQ